mgnify:FL=1
MFSGTRGHNKIMKNKDFNLIEFLKQKNIFVSNKDIKNKNFKMENLPVFQNRAHLSSISYRYKTLKNSVAIATNRSRNKNFMGGGASVINFLDFKNKKIITNKRGK